MERANREKMRVLEAWERKMEQLRVDWQQLQEGLAACRLDLSGIISALEVNGENKRQLAQELQEATQACNATTE
ncbi:MAG TPA: hypothetical protein DCQ14_04735, partial [Firmicutes bacterium]|nr:hypothetical protein [Bacillota bacterium]